MSLKAVYPGTFDPITNGHFDIIKRAANIFPTLIVAVADSRSKKPFFSLEERISFIKQSTANIENVEVMGFDNLLIQFVEKQLAQVIVRGLRAVSDFEYEFQLAGMNKQLSAQVETVFLTPSEKNMFLSSSLVKEIASFNGCIQKFVPKVVQQAFECRSV